VETCVRIIFFEYSSRGIFFYSIAQTPPKYVIGRGRVIAVRRVFNNNARQHPVVTGYEISERVFN